MPVPDPPESTGPISREAWMTFALARIRAVVDIPRERMTDDELTIYTFASNALAGGEPTIPLVARGAGHRLCRVCLAEWSSAMTPDHVGGCPAGSTTQTQDMPLDPDG